MIKLTDITKSYHKQLVLDSINLSITEPRLIALIAPNGSGKTTLMNIICNLEAADFGFVEINGCLNNNVQIFNDLSYMQDNSILYHDLTGMDHLKLIQDVYSIPSDYVEEIVETLKMSNYMKKTVRKYSLGMKQHLLFAMAILPRPKVLLLDEPLNGLDPASILDVRNILINLHQNGTTILFSSHNLDQIDKLTTDIYFLKNANLISYDELLNLSDTFYYEVVTDNLVAFQNFYNPIIKSIDILSEHTCRIQCETNKLDIKEYQEDFTIYEIREIKRELEDVYFELFKD